MKKSYELRKMNEIWGAVWKSHRLGLDFTDNLTLYKFTYYLKPILDQLPSNASIMEIGAGNFQWLLLIRAYRPDIRLIGLDCCDEAKNFADKYNIEFILADARNIPLNNESIDVVFSWGVVEHLDESETMVAEHIRVAKKFVVLDVPYKYSLPIIRLSYVNKKNGLSKEEEMFRDGKFYSRKKFKKLMKKAFYEAGSCSRLYKVKIFNNYSFLPSRLSFLEPFVPKVLRRLMGHNIGAVLEKCNA